jgi:ubiquinone/menaquinone biosynthesis C-methylase UbiE
MYGRLIRWFFARFYREFAWTYDLVAAAVSGGRWAEWGRASLPELRGQVLELGCGTGNLQRTLAQQSTSHWVVGLDASPTMLAITRRKLARAALPNHLTRGVAQALPFAPNSFDSIVATFPTDYILDSATLAEIWRVLHPNGRLVVVLAATFGRSGLYQRAIDLLYRITLQRPPAAPPSPSRRSILARRLAELGFAVEERWEPVGGNLVQLIVAERV